MDRDTMVLEVRRRLGEDAADFWADTEITRALNEAQRRFCHEADWSWLSTYASINLAINDTTFVLPNDVDINRVIVARVNITGTKSYKLRRVTPADGFRLMSTYDTAANPKWFFIYTTAQSGGALVTTARLVPKVQKAGTIDMLYYRRPAELLTGPQEPDIPEDYQEAIIAHATAKLWLWELDRSGIKANEQMAVYADIVDKALMHEAKLNDDEQLAIGKMDDEIERSGVLGPIRLPDNYGWPIYDYGDF